LSAVASVFILILILQGPDFLVSRFTGVKIVTFLLFKNLPGSMKNVKKQNLPEKLCPACNRPFAWRKKWEKNWDEVKYCSERCRNAKQSKSD